ncbi:hypothetical protein PCANC_26122, partial [Puccinia coronata f. sp. avenae]
VNFLSAIPEENHFDYVIVGAGTAGMALASRLSEDPKVQVAVVEAGIDYEESPVNKRLVDTPGADTTGCGSKDHDNATDAIDWRFHTIPQPGANNRTIRYARGKTVGGSSARNFMIYHRPSRGSLDKWAELTGDSEWTFGKRFGDYKKSVSFTPPKHDLRREAPAAQYDAQAFIGANGPVQVSYPNMAQSFSRYMQLSLNEKGLHSSQGFNGGTLDGVQYASVTIDPKDSHRSSSRAFYAAAHTRRNLVVYTNTMVRKIILDDSKPPRARGIELFHQKKDKLPDRLIAKKEVILSAGAFQSPQLLMVSGIGPKDQLKAHKIPIRVDNPNVGRGLQDHIFFGLTYPVYSIETRTRLAVSPNYTVAQYLNFTFYQQGPMTNNAADMISFEKFNTSQLAQLNAHSLSGYPSDWPHVEYLSAGGAVGDFSDLHQLNMMAGLSTGKEFVTILAALAAPQSRGTVKISSSDASVPPVIDPGWLTDPVDQWMAVQAFKRTREFFAAKAMKPILDGNEYLPGPSVKTDKQILEWIRNNLMTVWHAACTCAMRTKDQGGVLDSHFRVYGVRNLRVVDASAFPMLPPGHPQSTVYMIAERAASLIKKENS